MHGLARSGGEDARLMQSAWQRLYAELLEPCPTSVERLAHSFPGFLLVVSCAEEMAGESRVRHTALGALFAQQLDAVLASAAPVPPNCSRTGQDIGYATSRSSEEVVRTEKLLCWDASRPCILPYLTYN